MIQPILLACWLALAGTTFIHDGEQVISEWESPVTATTAPEIASDGDGSTTPGSVRQVSQIRSAA